MKKLIAAAMVASLAAGCITANKNDGGDDYLKPCIMKDKIHEKYEVGTTPVTATESINVIGFISWGNTATHIADQAPFRFWEKDLEVRNGAYANACDQAKCDMIVGARYNLRIQNYFVFKKMTCEITGYPAKIVGVELVPAKEKDCCCSK